MSNRPNMREAKERMREELYNNQIESIVGQQMAKLYPGWKWWVECRISTGLVSVRNLDLDGSYGFYVPIAKILHNPDSKLLMQAGGEILERYGQVRAGRPMNIEVDRDWKGEAIGDVN